MNDWPADPEVDALLRDHVNRELIAARTDAIGLTYRKPVRRSRQQLAFAAVGALAVVVVVGSLGLRGMRSGAAASDQPSASLLAAEQTNPTATVPATASASVPAAKFPTPQPVPTNAASPWFHKIGATMTTENAISVVLADGRVLFIGYARLPSFVSGQVAELFDPSTGKFTATGSPLVARGAETATRLQDGRVLVVGGYDSTTGGQYASAELYDPATGKFTMTGSLHTARQFHSATLLPDGRVLIAGGYVIKPVAEAPVAQAMAYHPVAVSGNQPATMTLEQGLLSSAEIYNPKTGTFTLTGSMRSARDYQTATLLKNGLVLIAGGETATSSTSAELYDPNTGKFSSTGSTRSPRWLAVATLLADGRVLLTGGRDSSDRIISTAEVYNPKTGKFTLTGSMSAGRQEHTATLLPDGRVLVAGGYSGPSMTANATSSAEYFNPNTGKFSSAGYMNDGRMDQTADLLPDGRVLIAGGDYIGPDGSTPITSAEYYQQ